MHRFFRALLLVAACGALTACGGGGSSAATPDTTVGAGTTTSTGASTTTTTGTSVTTTVTVTTTTIASVNNVQPIVVDAGPDPANMPSIDQLFTSVTICAPANPALCQTIDHVLVDTGSVGLRLISAVLSPALASALSAQTPVGGNTEVECAPFVQAYAWGPIRSVNMQIAGEVAGGLPMQVMGDPNFSSLTPGDCSAIGIALNAVDSLGANGLLGIGVFQQDCGSHCVASSSNGYYYSCSSLSSSCGGTAASLPQQVTNPVSLFAVDNNGVIISLPAVASGAAVSANGTMTFGVGTRSNNGFGNASVFPMNTSGNFTTNYNGAPLTDSFIDSGSNGLIFPNSTNIPTCSDGWYCPAMPLNLSATMVGKNNAGTAIGFSIANIDAALANLPNDAVYVPLGAPGQDNNSFDWGLPFFFGRSVIVVTENQAAGGNAGPFIAF